MSFSACRTFFKKPVWGALGLNILLVITSMFFGTGKYESLDDFFMSSVLTGAYGGEYDVHLFFINAIYGYLLKPFYALLPSVGWYGVFEMFCIFISFTVFTYYILKNFEPKWNKFLACFFLICVAAYYYFHVSFTQCSSTLTAAGMLLVLMGDKERNWKYACFGGALLVGGYVMRSDMFLLGTPILCALLGWRFLQVRKIWKITVVSLIACFAVVACLKFTNANLFKTDGYDYYAAYHPVRVVFADGDYYDVESLLDEVEERGLFSRDIRFLRSWYFYDNDVFSVDSLNKKIEFVKRNLFVPNYAKMPVAILRAISNNFSRPIFWSWLIFSAMLVFFSTRKNRYLPWVSLGYVAVGYLYLLLVNRVLIHVEMGIWVYAIALMIAFMDSATLDFRRLKKVVLCVLVFVSWGGVIYAGVDLFYDVTEKKSFDEDKGDSDWEGFWNYSMERSDDVFLLPFGRYKDLAAFKGTPYKAIEPGSWNNIFSTGYWNLHLPAMERELEKRGVKNLFRDITNDNVYVVSDIFERSFVPFYQDHYHERLVIDTVASFGKMRLLKYRRAEVEK